MQEWANPAPWAQPNFNERCKLFVLFSRQNFPILFSHVIKNQQRIADDRF